MSKLTPIKLNTKWYILYQITIIIPIALIALPSFTWWMWVIRIALGLFVVVQVWYTFVSKEWKIYEAVGITTFMNVIFIFGLLLLTNTWLKYFFIIFFALSNTVMIERIKKVNNTEA